ncbi:MAG: hypothetical protein HZA50_06035 [Planctomycetes bacterium]|nr:hypothetical protein [Planctomycetota bacterium]
MSLENVYVLSSLPSLGELGSRPPMTPRQFTEALDPDGSVWPIVQAVFLGDDLMQHQSVLAGVKIQPAPAVLTPEQVRGDSPLPEYLSGQAGATVKNPADAVWAAYFHHTADLAAGAGSKFLACWTTMEVALRNAIADARAKTLQLDPADFIVAGELGDGPESLAGLVRQWAGAADALAGQMMLDEFRWDWIDANEQYFTFADDELAAFAAKLMLLTRWDRMSKEMHLE